MSVASVILSRASRNRANYLRIYLLFLVLLILVRRLIFQAPWRVLRFCLKTLLRNQLRKISLHSLKYFSLFCCRWTLSFHKPASGTISHWPVFAVLFETVIMLITLKFIVCVVLLFRLIISWLMIRATEVVLRHYLFPCTVIMARRELGLWGFWKLLLAIGASEPAMIWASHFHDQICLKRPGHRVLIPLSEC